MGYADPVKQAQFQNKWLQSRRKEWIAENGPCKECQSTENLNVVKNDPSISTTKVFGWSLEMRKKVLEKCIVLCRPCMKKHYGAQFKKELTGKKGDALRLTPELVWAIRGLLFSKWSVRRIATYCNLNHSTVLEIQHGRIWGWLKGGRRKVYGLKKTDEASEKGEEANETRKNP